MKRTFSKSATSHIDPGSVGWFQSATMSSTSVLCLFIDSEKKPISTAFDVDVGKQVSNLKHNALKENPQEGVGPGGLRVWRCKDRNIVFNDSDLTELEDQITDIFESQQVESLRAGQAAADLQFSGECILLEILGMLYAIALYMILKQLTLHRPTKEAQV